MKTRTLEIVNQLNQEVADSLEKGGVMPPLGFVYKTDGFYEVIEFEGFTIWNSGMNTDDDYERTKETCLNNMSLLYNVLGDVINQIKS